MTKVCIIGHGYVGSALVAHFSPIAEVTCVTRSKPAVTNAMAQYVIASYDQLEECFYQLFDTVILAAGQSSPRSCSDLTHVLDNDVMGFTYLVNCINKKQKLIYISSAAIYGNNYSALCTETSPTHVQNNYDLAKVTIDHIASLNTTKIIHGLRIGTLNGPAPITRIDLMINKLVTDASRNGFIQVSNANPNRAILGVKDLCLAIERIIVSGSLSTKGIYNLCSFNNSTIDIAESIGTLLNVPVGVVYDVAQSKYDFVLDSTKFNKAFDFTPIDTLNSIVADLQNTPYIPSFVGEYVPDVTLERNCRVCSHATNELLDLGHQPLAKAYHTTSELLPTYPLQLQFCPNCFHVQLDSTVNPDILYRYAGVSKTLVSPARTHFYDFALSTLQRVVSLTNKNKIKVLDIAYNEPLQLDAFKTVANQLGVEIITVGVCMQNLNEASADLAHDVICGHFDTTSQSQLKEKYKVFDLIVAKNVFERVGNPQQLLQQCKRLCALDGLIYIQGSQANMIFNGEFYNAHHEHLSFFNTNSMKLLCAQNDLVLNKIEYGITKPYCTSYIFEISNSHTMDSNLGEILYDEMVKGLYSTELYEQYKSKCILYKNHFHTIVLQYKLQGYNIIGFGSTTNSNTLLNFCNINNSIISCIIDENPLKLDKLTPGSNIPICNTDILNNLTNNTLIIVFTWYDFDEIFAKLSATCTTLGPEIAVLNINPLTTHSL